MCHHNRNVAFVISIATQIQSIRDISPNTSILEKVVFLKPWYYLMFTWVNDEKYSSDASIPRNTVMSASTGILMQAYTVHLNSELNQRS